MEFTEKLVALSSKVQKQSASIETEEATKNAFIMPFISTILGYDVFNPLEVVPEFTADVGVKRGEKIDYAIRKDGEVQILIECKRSREALSLEHASQLYRYFATTNARIAILTNGEIYQFYTDLEAPNRMDKTPFLVLDLNNIDDVAIPELRKLTKEVFDLDSVLNAAEELKYVGAIKRAISTQFKEPDDDWIRFFTSRVYQGQFTQKIREQFTELVRKAAKQFLNDQVNSRLKNALGSQEFPTNDLESDPDPETSISVAEDSLEDKGIVTTMEELDGYRVVRAIVCSEVKSTRIAKRDTKSYFGILLDDNNRRPIARLHFNRPQKYLGIFDENKEETRVAIDGVEDIYTYSDKLRQTVHYYE